MNVAPLMQFDDSRQQQHAASLGTWVFLGSEVMFFGGLFLAYIVYRYEYPDAFIEGGKHIKLWSGSIMTALLLTSSFTIVLAESALKRQQHIRATGHLVFTILLGTIFLALKGHEYLTLWNDRLVPGIHFDTTRFRYFSPDSSIPQLFFCFYFFMTGLHALHMLIGITLVSIMAVSVQQRGITHQNPNPLEMTALYWHFIDIVWVFLFPLLYLVGE